jgi:magnesium-dependent phosphatase 1
MPISCIVFDLDFTLWNAGGTWCDHTSPPYRKINQHVVDSENNEIVLYADVLSILAILREKYVLAVASRTYQPAWARELMKLLEIEPYFSYFEIYPSTKTVHFHSLRDQTGISFRNMLFFDDEMQNVHDVAQLGVTGILVHDGITKDIIRIQLKP